MSQSTTVVRSKSDRNSPLTCIDDYVFHRNLGKGSMGKVKLGVHHITGEKVAVKIVRRANFQINGFTSTGKPRTKEQMMKEKAKEETRELRTIREAHIMMLLRHPHIVQLKNLVAVGPYFYILMDYVNGGQLLHYIVKQKRLSESHTRRFTRQIVSALDYMHRNSIVHRDLKIENILIDKAGRNIKIIDFGLSNLFCPERRLTTYCGSLYFAAPELLRASPYRGPEVDVWSLGVVIYVMITGSVPFDDKSMPGLHEKIKRGQVAYPAYLDGSCRDLLSRIFVIDPTKRILLADVIRHEWVNQGCRRLVKNYLPLRLPIAPPLAPHILQHMTRGFNMGGAEDIRIKMEMIIKSNVYRSAAEHIALIQHAAMVPNNSQQPQQKASDETSDEFRWTEYDDPQTIPAAYHPLLSIYHLTRERLSHQEIEQESDSPIKQTQQTMLPLTPPSSDDGERDYEEEDDVEDGNEPTNKRYSRNDLHEKKGLPLNSPIEDTLTPTVGKSVVAAGSFTSNLPTIGASHHPPPLLSNTDSSISSNSSLPPIEIITSLEQQTHTNNKNKSPEKNQACDVTAEAQKEQAKKQSVLYRSTTSLAAILSRVMCNH